MVVPLWVGMIARKSEQRNLRGQTFCLTSLRRTTPAIAINPVPDSINVLGSGTPAMTMVVCPLRKLSWLGCRVSL